jgi:hypothetical protein
MAKLLYSAIGADGQSADGFVEAVSVQEGRRQLEAQGMTDVVLYNAPGFAFDEAEAPGLSDGDLQSLAKLHLAVMQKPGLWPALIGLAQQLRWWLLGAIGLVAYGAFSRSPVLLGLGAGAAALPFLVLLWRWRHVGRYNQLLRAFAIGRWHEVRRLGKLLARRRGNSASMGFEFALRQAYADVIERSLEQALARVEPWRERLAGEPGLFEMRVAMLHHAAGDWASFIRLHAQALEKLPGDPSRTVDLALAHARHGDADRAAELMAGLDLSLLPPWGKGFVHWVNGLVQMRRQEPSAAATLGAAVAEFLKLSSQPTVWTALAFATIDHALALKTAGRTEEARLAVGQVWPIFKAHAHAALLRLLQTEGLAPPSAR